MPEPDNWLPSSDNWLTESDNCLPESDNCTGNTVVNSYAISSFAVCSLPVVHGCNGTAVY